MPDLQLPPPSGTSVIATILTRQLIQYCVQKIVPRYTAKVSRNSGTSLIDRMKRPFIALSSLASRATAPARRPSA